MAATALGKALVVGAGESFESRESRNSFNLVEIDLTDGERVNKIVSAYRGELSKGQEYFLKMLSLHPYSVTERNFSVLIEGYDDTNPGMPGLLET